MHVFFRKAVLAIVMDKTDINTEPRKALAQLTGTSSVSVLAGPWSARPVHNQPPLVRG